MRRAWEAGEGRVGESVGVQAGPILVCELVHLPADVARQRLGRQPLQRLDAHVCPGAAACGLRSQRVSRVESRADYSRDASMYCRSEGLLEGLSAKAAT